MALQTIDQTNNKLSFRNEKNMNDEYDWERIVVSDIFIV